MDVYGNERPAKDGREAKSPQGKNTTYNEEENVLFAACDGIINYVTDVVNVNDVMHISGNVDNGTGNIDFSGDVIVEGDVCEGYNIRAGRNLIVKGLVESCIIEAGGDVQIVKGVNGDDNSHIKVGGNLRSLYVEHSKVEVEGDILAESIIDSEITCQGDIDLSNSGKGILVGGTINIKGDLVVKTLGNENERITNIKIIGIETGVQDELTSLQVAKENYVKTSEKLKTERRKIFQPMLDDDDPIMIKIKDIDNQLATLTRQIDETTHKIQEVKNKWSYEYKGSVECKGKIYYGARISFGDERYQFTTESLDHCKIYWDEGEIISAPL